VTPPHGRQRRRLTATETDLGVVRQRALLVGGGNGTAENAEASLDELALLTETAGAEPVERALQRRDTPDPSTFIGKGKAEELRVLAEALDLDLVVFDDELSPAQQRNLEKLFKLDVVDRVALILDIFAQHAHSQAGMLQVELAQLRYRLPRLRGRGVEMSRLGAGIGTRGPGETQLEVDRRRILRRIAKLEREMNDLSRTRSVQRKSRLEAEHPQVALVGYTNAGKSTLLNRLTGAGVLVEDRLFSTLDPTIRRLSLPGGEIVLLSDTVGFVGKLPHQLVESFRSTLEEVVDADLLIHVVDASAVEPGRQIDAVRAVLAEIEAGSVPELLVANKSDVADPEVLAELVAGGAVPVSALSGDGIDGLLERLAARLRALNAVVELSVPYDRGDVLAAVHREGEVLVEVHDERATRVQARLPRRGLERFREFLARLD
jgi:GTP-binding protein HflX